MGDTNGQMDRFPMETIEHLLWFCDPIISLTEELKKWELFVEVGFSGNLFSWLVFDAKASEAKQTCVNIVNWIAKYFI